MPHGWDEGFDVPSLGIAIRPGARGIRLSKAFMLFLHAAAKFRDANPVRLKLHKEHPVALRLFETVEYRCVEQQNDELICYVDL